EAASPQVQRTHRSTPLRGQDGAGPLSGEVALVRQVVPGTATAVTGSATGANTRATRSGAGRACSPGLTWGHVVGRRARADWGWAPAYDFARAFDEYLIPAVTRRYRGKGE